MPSAVCGFPSAVRVAVRSNYVIAGAIWLVALAFAGYRVYQMRTLTPLEAEVLKAEVHSRTVADRDTDPDGFTTYSETRAYVPVVWVRYQFNNKVYTAETRPDTAGLLWVQERIARQWKQGGRIRVHVDPHQPDKPVAGLGLNLATFQLTIALTFAGFLFALVGYGIGRLTAFGAGMLERHADGTAVAALWLGRERPVPASVAVEDDELPVPVGTATAVAGVVCCVVSPLFDPLGYVLTVLGVILLWASDRLSTRERLVATAIVLPPRVAPLSLSALAAPGEFSFVLHRNPLATSSSAWGWYGLLLVIGAALMLMFTDRGNALLVVAGLKQRSLPGARRERDPLWLTIPGVLVLAAATAVLFGLRNDFEWVEAADAGAWDLKHTMRGTVARFRPESVASIDAAETGDKDEPTYRVRVALTSGVAGKMTTRTPSVLYELRQMAATMQLPAGRVRLKSLSGEEWTNRGFTLKGCTGRYEGVNGDVVDLRLDRSGRLTGSETVLEIGGQRINRPIRVVKVTEDGAIEYRTGAFAFSAGHFEKDGLVIGEARFRKSGK